MERIRFIRIVQPLEVSIALTIGLWLLLNTLIKNKYRTSLLVTYFLLLFFSYGHVYNALEWLLTTNTEGETNIGLFSLWLIFLTAGGFLIIRLHKNLTGITKVLSKIGIFLLILSLLQILYFNVKFNRILSSNPVTSGITELVDLEDQNVSLDTTSFPNIYYIILDGYASNEVLKDIYGYDNTAFVSFLERKGFKVSSQARSNYSQTALSISSSLNMKYINDLADILGENSTNRVILTNMIKDNEVIRFLKSKGYTTINFSSGWHATDRNRFANINIFCIRNNDILTNLLLTTMLRPVENLFMKQEMRERVLCNFSRLASISREAEGPIFAFAHFIPPHPAFIFGSNGEFVGDSKLKTDNDFSNKKAYIDQLRFLNKKVEELVGKLISDNNNPPIIIIQADHGTASTPGMEEYNPALIQERMRPFVASYLPSKNNFIPDSITPVNIFRLIFNNYFNTKLEILKNNVYFSTYGKPYKFVDVTDDIWKSDH